MLFLVSARRPTAEFGGVDSGMTGEFAGTIAHLFFSMVTQFDNYQHRNHMGVRPDCARRRVDLVASPRTARRLPTGGWTLQAPVLRCGD
jgi:hypothetical protein